MESRNANWIWIATIALLVGVFQTACQRTPETSETSAKPAEPSTTAKAPAQPQTLPSSTAARRPPQAPAPRATEPAPVAQPVTLAAGTVLKVRTTSVVTTDMHRTGDAFSATLEEPLMAGGRVIAPKGSLVDGRVVEADKGGRVEGVARLSVALSQVNTPEGRTFNIQTNSITVEAHSTKSKDAAKIAVGTGIGAVVGAIAGGKKGAAIGAGAGAGAGTGVVLATRGDAAQITGETLLEFSLASPVAIR